MPKATKTICVKPKDLKSQSKKSKKEAKKILIRYYTTTIFYKFKKL